MCVVLRTRTLCRSLESCCEWKSGPLARINTYRKRLSHTGNPSLSTLSPANSWYSRKRSLTMGTRSNDGIYRPILHETGSCSVRAFSGQALWLDRHFDGWDHGHAAWGHQLIEVLGGTRDQRYRSRVTHRSDSEDCQLCFQAPNFQQFSGTEAVLSAGLPAF